MLYRNGWKDIGELRNKALLLMWLITHPHSTIDFLPPPG